MSSLSKNYGNIIWTNHAMDRLGQRGLTQAMAWETFQNPEHSEKQNEGSLKLTKQYEKSKVTVIAKKNEKREWIILSCWIYPPIEGTSDYKKKTEYKKYQKTTGIRRFLIAFKNQIFGS